MKGHIVFDCDGTLIDSAGPVRMALKQIYSEWLGQAVSDQEFFAEYDPDVNIMFEKVGADTLEKKKELHRRWTQLAQQYQGKYELFEGVKELFHFLEDQEFGLYVWTARGLKSTREILTKLGIARYLIDIKCPDNAPLKPNPQALNEMLLTNDKIEVVVIGDSYTDMLGAKHYGCRSIGANWSPESDAQILKEFGATQLAKKPIDCVEILSDWFNL